jgi:hypothetical protein
MAKTNFRFKFNFIIANKLFSLALMAIYQVE